MTQRRIYKNEFPYFITFRTREGLPLFDKTKYAVLLSDIMFNAGKLKQYDIVAYQIMLDHVHALVYQKNVDNIHRAQASLPALLCLDDRAPTEGCARRNVNISQLIHTIKSYFCDVIRDRCDINYPIFQKRFYARIVDTDKYLRTVIQYMINNPIKVELLEKYQKLPYQFVNEKKIRTLF